jgi:hypothetical protein
VVCTRWVVLALLLTLATAAVPAAAEEPVATVTYTVETRGAVQTELDAFRWVARSALDDRRGWSLDGAIEFREVPVGGDFRLVLATPAEVEAAHEICEAAWSCRVEDDVLINEERWTRGSIAYPLPLADYRSYVVNHEVGHWLGLPHEDCTGERPAPVMAQQSKGVGTCEATVWPLDHERAAVAFRYGVEPPAPWRAHGRTSIVVPGIGWLAGAVVVVSG